jgi:hypothetical protein
MDQRPVIMNQRLVAMEESLGRQRYFQVNLA